MNLWCMECLDSEVFKSIFRSGLQIRKWRAQWSLLLQIFTFYTLSNLVSKSSSKYPVKNSRNKAFVRLKWMCHLKHLMQSGLLIPFYPNVKHSLLQCFCAYYPLLPKYASWLSDLHRMEGYLSASVFATLYLLMISKSESSNENKTQGFKNCKYCLLLVLCNNFTKHRKTRGGETFCWGSWKVCAHSWSYLSPHQKSRRRLSWKSSCQ